MQDEFDLSSLSDYDFIEGLLDSDPYDFFDFGMNCEEILEPETRKLLEDLLLYPHNQQ